MQSTLIVGAGGQDGRILEDQLLAAGQRVLSIGRAGVTAHGVDWSRPIDITRAGEVAAAVQALRPAAVYHLAALHQSSEEAPPDDLASFRAHYEVNFFSLLHFLEAIRTTSPSTRLFYAASSHIFGTPPAGIQDETTPLHPESIYAMTKADGLLACRLYRTRHRLSASTGILYTHESAHRDERFLAMKIARAVHRIKAGVERTLRIGQVDAVIDWGWAPDYVEAMRRIVGADEAGEFVIATGERHTVREFLAIAFDAVGLDWSGHVLEDPAILARPSPVRIGNSARLRAKTGWSPRVGFEEMVRRLVESQAPGASAS